MGTLLKNEKSADKQFQISVWKNEWGISVNIKKFKRMGDGRILFTKFESINFGVQEFENFKTWLKGIKKKK